MNSVKSFSIFVIILFLSGFLIAGIAKQFRFIEDLRWIYHIGWVLCYMLHFAALISSFVFLICLLKKDFAIDANYKFAWIALGLVPFLVWIILFILFYLNSSEN